MEKKINKLWPQFSISWERNTDLWPQNTNSFPWNTNSFPRNTNSFRIILSLLDPIGSQARQTRRLRRRQYFAEGPNYVWHIDLYDKLKPYGICINGCIDGFSRQVIWLRATLTNSNPKVIGGYFVEALERCGGCPRLVRALRTWWSETFSVICGEMTWMIEQRREATSQGQVLRTRELRAGGEWWEKKESNCGSWL